MTSIRRGDLVVVAGGVYASKPRPAIVIQDDLFDGTVSVTVCPLTTTAVDAPLLRMAIASSHENGLDVNSFAMVDKVTTVRRNSIRESIGQLNSVQMIELERRLLVFLGLAH